MTRFAWLLGTILVYGLTYALYRRAQPRTQAVLQKLSVLGVAVLLLALGLALLWRMVP